MGVTTLVSQDMAEKERVNLSHLVAAFGKQKLFRTNLTLMCKLCPKEQKQAMLRMRHKQETPGEKRTDDKSFNTFFLFLLELTAKRLGLMRPEQLDMCRQR